MSRFPLLVFRHVRVALPYFAQSGFFEFVDQVVGFDAETSPATDLDVRLLGVVAGEFVAELASTTRSQRDNFVGKVNGVAGSSFVA
jgi:hypothetical protein